VGEAGGEGVAVGAWGCVATGRHATSDAATSTTHSTPMPRFTSRLLHSRRLRLTAFAGLHTNLREGE